ncbi:MAG TPA: aspartate/glutamate racemase family protein [Phycisphaerae bacterium]|nr:aspartate/glutamate racemase family protein [Phycisphaerae bacterium]HRY70529.1 aspartate/glutamate racemase family protein [Phycisphaerae bacterium]HSA27977.1 aspartate/glutamate racemase family protein [Phycisphaerae bacterium]
MKTIGLIGGMSWESSVEYYRIVNQAVRRRLGGLHSAQCVMFSFDFTEIVALQRKAAWDEAASRMIEAGNAVKKAGADFIVICTNTMHKLAPALEAAVPIPLLHIADPTAREAKARGIRKIGLLATKFTMEEEFYVERLSRLHGLEVLVPESSDRQRVHSIIFDELCQGRVLNESRTRMQAIIQSLADKGAQGIMLGCTELGLLIKDRDCPLPLFDTTVLHAEAAAEMAMA